MSEDRGGPVEREAGAAESEASGRAGAKSGGAWDAYRAAGVDIDAGEKAVEMMRASVAATRRPEVIGGWAASLRRCACRQG